MMYVCVCFDCASVCVCVALTVYVLLVFDCVICNMCLCLTRVCIILCPCVQTVEGEETAAGTWRKDCGEEHPPDQTPPRYEHG